MFCSLSKSFSGIIDPCQSSSSAITMVSSGLTLLAGDHSSFASPKFLSPRHAVIKQIINVIAIGAKENAGESQSPAGAYRYAMVARR